MVNALSTADDHSIPSLDFELDCSKTGLQEMSLASVASDRQLAIGPIRNFVSADQKFQGERFEDV